MKPVSDRRPSGDRQMARLLMAALGRAGFTVETASVFASYDGTGDASRQRRLEALGRTVAATLIRRYRRLEDSERPDLWFTYHLYHKAPDWLGPAVSRALRIPYVVAEASHAPKQRNGPWSDGFTAAGAAIAAADLVFNINRADAAAVRQLLVDPARLVPLAPFVDTEASLNGRDRRRVARARRVVMVDHATPLLLCVAMMRPGDKLASYRCLGRSLGLVRDRPWRLVVAGDGPARGAVEAALAPLGRRVRFLGLLDGPALQAAYAAADLCVWPAIGEAYGMALLEAQAAGVPVVAGRTGGVADVVAHGRSGVLVPVAEPQAFAAAVRWLLKNRARRTAMAEAARTRVRQRHNLPAAAARLRAQLMPLVKATET